MSEEPRLLAIPPQIAVERHCPITGLRATLARAPYPRERVWAHRIGLVSTEEYVQDLVRHVRAESRRNGQLSVAEIEDLAACQERARAQAALRSIALALVVDMLIGGVLFGFAQL
jgi:hypothetical protein